MTREHKLAMIVGFALVLVVGVLVSDHLSGARKARIASVDMAGQEMGAREVDVAFGRKPEPAPTVMLARRQAPPPVTFDGEERSTLAAPTDESIETIAANAPAAEDPLHVAETGILGFESKLPPATIQTDALQGEHLVMGAKRDVPPGFIRVPEGDDSIAPLGGEGEPTRVAANADEPTPVKPEKARTRTVREGETLWSIAADVYGDGKLHKKLAEYNKSRLGSGGQLREGASILIPDKDVLLGKSTVAKAVEPKAEKAANSIAAKSEAAKKTSKGTYVIKKGDTLAAIAKRELGSAGRWEEILELNSSELDDETSIRPGMTIKLPR